MSNELAFSRDQLLVMIMILMLIMTISEVIYSIIRKKKTYNWRETLANLIMGIGQQSLNVLIIPVLALSYSLIQENYAIFKIDNHNLWHWFILIIACDFIYYCAHRISHRVNIFVAAHIGHHQHHDYNHASAFRQGWFAHLFIFPFFLTLAFLGFELQMFMLAQLGIMFVQFFSHNGVITRKLGWLEYVFITPRSHKVHHGIEDEYIDNNCGGMLVIWDRLFGTYADLGDKITYGTRTEVNRFDPIASNFNYFYRIYLVSKKRHGFINKLKIWFQTPEVLAQEFQAMQISPIQDKISLWEPSLLALISMLTMIFLMTQSKSLSLAPKALLSSFIIFLLWQTGKSLTRQNQIKVKLARLITNLIK